MHNILFRAEGRIITEYLQPNFIHGGVLGIGHILEEPTK